MAEDGARARKRSTLPLGLAVALVVNGTALLILTRTGKGPLRLTASAPLEFQLIRLSPRTQGRPRPAAARSAPSAVPARPHLPTAEATSTSPALAAPASTPAPGPGGPGPASDGAEADLGRIFRTNLGCSDPGGLRLTPEERARCMARLGSGARQAPMIPAPMDPGKRAWFAAAHAAYNPTDPLDGDLAIPLGCKIRFNGPKAKFKPPHSLKIPGLPCYVIPPRGVLTEESHIASPEHVQTR